MPSPEKVTMEMSKNSFGARYRFTLEEISDVLDDELEDMNIPVKKDDWEILSEGLVDDNGVRYSSYCNRKNSIVFTAAAEEKSKKLMNIGCGCKTDQLNSFAYRTVFVRIAAKIAVCADGYADDALDALMRIFMTLLNGDEDTLSYQGALYIKSVDKETTVLMTAACSEAVVKEKNYQEVTR